MQYRSDVPDDGIDRCLQEAIDQRIQEGRKVALRVAALMGIGMSSTTIGAFLAGRAYEQKHGDRNHPVPAASAVEKGEAIPPKQINKNDQGKWEQAVEGRVVDPAAKAR